MIKTFLKYLFLMLFICILYRLTEINILHINNKVEIYNFTSFSIICEIIFIPFFEELIYRLGLKFKPSYLSFMSSAIFFSFFLAIINLNYDIKNIMWLKLLILSFVFLGFVFFVLKIIFVKNFEKVKFFYYKKFNFIFYLSIFLFTISHYFNYENYSFFMKLYYLTFIFIVGYFFSKIRLKHGFYAGLTLHIIFNVISNIMLSKFNL